jgi:hypothetical protein
VALAFWSTRMLERIDRSFSEGEEL